MYDSLFSVFGIAELLVKWGVGWRYVLSGVFRKRVHEQWAKKATGTAIALAVGYGFLFVAANAILLIYPVLAAVWLWQDVVLKHVGS